MQIEATAEEIPEKGTKLYDELWQEYLESVPAGSNVKVSRAEKLERRRQYNRQPEVRNKRRQYERRPEVRFNRWLKNRDPSVKAKRQQYSQLDGVKKRRKTVANRRRQAATVALELLKNGLACDTTKKTYKMISNFIIEDDTQVVYTNRWGEFIRVQIDSEHPFDPENPYWDPSNHTHLAKSFDNLVEHFIGSDKDQKNNIIKIEKSNDHDGDSTDSDSDSNNGQCDDPEHNSTNNHE